MLYGPIALVLGSRPTGLGGMVEEPRAGFHVPEWGVFCHTERLRDHPARLNLVLSDSALAALAGHSHISTTQRYIDVNSEQLSEAVELL